MSKSLRSLLLGALVAALAAPLPACSVFAFLRPKTADELISTASGWRQHLAELGAQTKAFEELAPLSVRIAAHPETVELRRVRADVLVELAAVLAWMRAVDPAEAALREEALMRALVDAVEGPVGPDSLGRLVADDLRAAGADPALIDGARAFVVEVAAGRVPEAAGPGLDAAQRLVQLACGIDVAGTSVTGGVADVLETRCRIAPVSVAVAAGVPDAQSSDPLIAEFLTLAASEAAALAGLAAVAHAVAGDGLGAGASARVADSVTDVLGTLDTWTVPLRLDADALALDPRLDVPRSVRSAEAVDWDADAAWRVLLLRSDGISAVPRPAVVVRNTVPATAALSPWTGAWATSVPSQLRFDGVGAVGAESLVDDRIPAVGDYLSVLETILLQADILPPDQTLSEVVPTPLAAIADGAVYASTLLAALRTAQDHGYAPQLHIAQGGSLRTVRLLVTDDLDSPAHELIIRIDGYSLTAFDPQALAVPQVFSRTSPDCLLALVRALDAARQGGQWDPALPLRVRVEDGSLDWGVLAHLLDAVSWRRDTTGVADDVALQHAPALVELGVPQALWPAGVVISDR